MRSYIPLIQTCDNTGNVYSQHKMCTVHAFMTVYVRSEATETRQHVVHEYESDYTESCHIFSLESNTFLNYPKMPRMVKDNYYLKPGQAYRIHVTQCPMVHISNTSVHHKRTDEEESWKGN